MGDLWGKECPWAASLSLARPLSPSTFLIPKENIVPLGLVLFPFATSWKLPAALSALSPGAQAPRSQKRGGVGVQFS